MNLIFFKNQQVVFIFLILLIASGCTRKQKQETAAQQDFQATSNQPDTFTVAFYNVENLFDPTYNGGEYAEYNPTLSNWDREMFQIKIDNTAEVITSLNPSIIGLCEIENLQALKSLQKKLKESGTAYPYSVLGDRPLKTNTCTALLSQYPIVTSSFFEVRTGSGKISRNIIEADIKCNSGTFKVFVNHWPSKGHPEADRIIASRVLADHINTLPAGTDYIIMGDLNSNYDEYRYIKKGSRKSNANITGINTYLQTTRNEGNAVFFVSQENIRQFQHYNLWLELPDNLRMSEMYKGYPQTLDHILIPSTMLDSSGISYVDNSFNVFTNSGKLLKNNEPFRWQFKRIEKQKMHTGSGYSDHLPVFAKFCTTPFTINNMSPANKTDVDISYNTGKLPANVPETYNNEQWRPCNNKVEFHIVDTSYKGQPGIHLQSGLLSSNISAARLQNFKPSGSILIYIKGSGKISFRFRKENAVWVYYNAPEFKQAKAAKYKEITYLKWTKIYIPLQKDSTDTPIEFEIRLGKEITNDFYISGLP
jgi:endonuclease/exonuclease/phosphatase family metal-dependent hydrolase